MYRPFRSANQTSRRVRRRYEGWETLILRFIMPKNQMRYNHGRIWGSQYEQVTVQASLTYKDHQLELRHTEFLVVMPYVCQHGYRPRDFFRAASGSGYRGIIFTFFAAGVPAPSSLTLSIGLSFHSVPAALLCAGDRSQNRGRVSMSGGLGSDLLRFRALNSNSFAVSGDLLSNLS